MWHEFDINNGRNQQLPDERKWVLVQIQSEIEGIPNPVVAGYLRYAAGDKDSPHFIIPGYPQPRDKGLAIILRWCDCVTDFQYPDV